jgi:hypothetical protein
MIGAGGTPERVEKLMGLTEGEFLHSIAALEPSQVDAEALIARFDFSTGSVVVSFEALPMAVLGGVVRMPRARVKLAFQGLEQSERAAFLRRFDIRFQRGGG